MSNFDYDDYAAQVATLAMYPHAGERNIASLNYPVLGLCGESAELTEKVHQNAELTDIDKEFGDVLWYITRTAAELGSSLAEVVGQVREAHLQLDSVDKFAALRELTIAVGVIAEQLKKSMRDDAATLNEPLSSERHDKVFAALVKVFAALEEAGELLDIDPADAAEHNLDKLFSRKQRNVLKGSGDNR